MSVPATSESLDNAIKPMRLLYIVDSVPYPTRKGYQLIVYNQITRLAKRHRIDLIAFGDGAGADAGVEHMRTLCADVELVPRTRRESWLSVLRALPSRFSLAAAFYRCAQMERLVRARLRTTQYDVVIVQLGRMAQYLPADYRGASVLNMVDPIILSHQRVQRWRPWYVRLGLRTEIARLKHYEPRFASRFTRVLLIVKADIEEYRRFLGGAKVEAVRYAIDVHEFVPAPAVARTPGMIVITGSMFYAPNVDAVLYFCREIFPLVRRAVPEATVWIVGARPTASLRNLAKTPGMHVTGSVDDVRPYVHRAMVSVCPVLLNVGTQTKVLEALGMATPVVTTSAGNHGIAARSGQELLVADSPTDFAAAVVSILRDRNVEEMTRRGREFVVENFSWDGSVARFEQVLDDVRREVTS